MWAGLRVWQAGEQVTYGTAVEQLHSVRCGPVGRHRGSSSAASSASCCMYLHVGMAGTTGRHEGTAGRHMGQRAGTCTRGTEAAGSCTRCRESILSRRSMAQQDVWHGSDCSSPCHCRAGHSRHGGSRSERRS